MMRKLRIYLCYTIILVLFIGSVTACFNNSKKSDKEKSNATQPVQPAINEKSNATQPVQPAIIGGWGYSSGIGGLMFTYHFKTDGTFIYNFVTSGNMINGDGSQVGKYRVEGNRIYFTDIYETWNDSNNSSKSYKNRRLNDENKYFKFRVNNNKTEMGLFYSPDDKSPDFWLKKLD